MSRPHHHSFKEFVELTRTKSHVCKEHQETEIEEIAATAFEETAMKATQHETEMSECPCEEECDKEAAIMMREVEVGPFCDDNDTSDSNDEVQVRKSVRFSTDSDDMQ